MKNWGRADFRVTSFQVQLVACGMNYNDGDTEVAVRRVITALTHAVGDERGQWLLGPQQDVRNELRMTAVIGGRACIDLVIDRTFCDENGQRLGGGL